MDGFPTASLYDVATYGTMLEYKKCISPEELTLSTFFIPRYDSVALALRQVIAQYSTRIEVRNHDSSAVVCCCLRKALVFAVSIYILTRRRQFPSMAGQVQTALNNASVCTYPLRQAKKRNNTQTYVSTLHHLAATHAPHAKHRTQQNHPNAQNNDTSATSTATISPPYLRKPSRTSDRRAVPPCKASCRVAVTTTTLSAIQAHRLFENRTQDGVRLAVRAAHVMRPEIEHDHVGGHDREERSPNKGVPEDRAGRQRRKDGRGVVDIGVAKPRGVERNIAVAESCWSCG